jgi:hypothetical protein
MAAEGMPFPWRWDGGTISTNLDCIWGMSIQADPDRSQFYRQAGGQNAVVANKRALLAKPGQEAHR